MTEIVTGIKLVAVSGRLKLALLAVVIAAILYVLISPLPELAATSTLNFPVLPSIVAFLAPKLLDLGRTPAVQITDVWLDEDLPSWNCALLC